MFYEIPTGNINDLPASLRQEIEDYSKSAYKDCIRELVVVIVMMLEIHVKLTNQQTRDPGVVAHISDTLEDCHASMDNLVLMMCNENPEAAEIPLGPNDN